MNGRYTFYNTLIVAFTLIGLFLMWRLGETVVVLLAAIIFASAIRPIIDRLGQWRIPRGLAILLVFLVGFGTIGGLLAVALPPLFSVITNLVSEGSLLARLGGLALPVAQRLGYGEVAVQAFAELVKSQEQVFLQAQVMVVEQGPQVLGNAVKALGQFALGLVMTFYWLTARDKIVNLMLALTPVRHRGRVETITGDVEKTMGDWLRGTGILMLSIGVAAFVGLVVLRVPNPLALALIAGLFEAIPMVGAALGALPAILIAFTVSPVTGLLTLLLFAFIQFAENNVLVPRVMEHSVGLNPLLVIIAVVVGGSLNGMVGALLAIPVAGSLQVIVRNLLVEPMIEEARQAHDERGITVFDLDDVPEQPSGEILIARS
ncbi:MAG TPA: AI-2E family transporter [Ardenticatenaceae bacterium]